MKKVTLALVAMIITFSLMSTDAQQSPTPLNTNAKYQLFQGKWIMPGEKASIERIGVFRIDVETGRTWIYWNAVYGDTLYNQWSLIHDPYLKYEHTMDSLQQEIDKKHKIIFGE